MRKSFLNVLAIMMMFLLATCGGSPTEPRLTAGLGESSLAAGRWSGPASCMSVNGQSCELLAGCWRGHFSRPMVHADGTFSVDGVFRFEAGPSKDDPAPDNAHFTGSIVGSTLTLTIQRLGNSPPPEVPIAFDVTLAGEGSCPSLCV